MKKLIIAIAVACISASALAAPKSKGNAGASLGNGWSIAKTNQWPELEKTVTYLKYKDQWGSELRTHCEKDGRSWEIHFMLISKKGTQFTTYVNSEGIGATAFTKRGGFDNISFTKTADGTGYDIEYKPRVDFIKARSPEFLRDELVNGVTNGDYVSMFSADLYNNHGRIVDTVSVVPNRYPRLNTQQLKAIGCY